MNKIEKLIAELCPEGVEYKELGEIAHYPKNRISFDSVDTQNYVGVDNLLQNKQGKTESKYVPTSGNLISYRINDVLIGNIRPYLKKIWLATNNGGTNGDVVVVRVNDEKSKCLIPRFLYYLLSSDTFFDYNMKFAKGTKMPRGNKDAILKFPIPIPPLAIQEEIVKILDTFSALEAKLKAELEAELVARKKQYEYYREELLRFGEDACLPDRQVQWRELGEVTYYPKNRISSAIVDNTNYVGVDNLLQNKQGKTDSNYVPTTGNLIEYRINDVLIGNIRPYLKKIWLSTNNGGTNGDVVIIRINDENKKELIPRYLYFLLSSDKFFDYDMRFAKGAKMPRGNKDAILKYKIPIPSLAEQERIVAILDKFDALVNDLSSGLPAEIAARKNQYEYYRNKLLTFKPLEKVHVG